MKKATLCAILLAATTVWSQTTVEIVLDASDGMLRRVGERTIHEGTLDAIIAVLGEAEESGEDLTIGLRLAGGGADEHQRCSATGVFIPLDEPDGDLWAEALAAVEPIGPRPLYFAVAAAIENVSGDERDFRVVIVTSGNDQCESGPEVVVAALDSADHPVDLRLVGLGLDPATVESFGSIAGKNATNADELLAALRWAILGSEDSQSVEPDPEPTPPPATLTAPPQVTAGEDFRVEWFGPENAEDFLSLALAGSPDFEYIEWARVEDGNPSVLRAPSAPGEYELRYVDGEKGEAYARTAIEVTAIPIELTAPATATAGTRFEVVWTGPASPGDIISISKPGAAPNRYLEWASITEGSPLTLAAPSKPGTYQVRYVARNGSEILAQIPIEIRQ